MKEINLQPYALPDINKLVDEIVDTLEWAKEREYNVVNITLKRYKDTQIGYTDSVMYSTFDRYYGKDLIVYVDLYKVFTFLNASLAGKYLIQGLLVERLGADIIMHFNGDTLRIHVAGIELRVVDGLMGDGLDYTDENRIAYLERDMERDYREGVVKAFKLMGELDVEYLSLRVAGNGYFIEYYKPEESCIAPMVSLDSYEKGLGELKELMEHRLDGEELKCLLGGLECALKEVGKIDKVVKKSIFIYLDINNKRLEIRGN